jgi:hypothetical protein
MSARDDFSPVEWAILTELPIRVLAAAFRADESSGLGSILEQATGLAQLSQGANQYGASGLVQEVFAQYKAEGEGESKALELSEQWVDQLEPETFVRARQASEILKAKAQPEDALAYKLWLLETAEAVCAAAKTGGFLGIGGERISEQEKAFLDALALAFEIPATPETEDSQ